MCCAQPSQLHNGIQLLHMQVCNWSFWHAHAWALLLVQREQTRPLR
jgi:hypothetical protein